MTAKEKLDVTRIKTVQSRLLMMMDHQITLDNLEHNKPPNTSCINMRMYFILSGTADVIMLDSTNKNKEVLIAELRPGEIFGVSDLLRITVSKQL
jgi:CRP-like cAMP-binding protein